MANDLNQCNFIGRLGKDPETRYQPSGDAVSNFSIAVGWKSKDKEGAEWVNITAFGKLGEICDKYLKKGSQVFISGRFKTDKYTDKEGVERYSTKIIADTMQMLGGKPESNDGESRSESRSRSHSTPEDFRSDDIPF
jgi:single-strand DNA-binding protein